MIPLVWFLVLWIAGVSLFFLLSFFTVTLALRFGLSGARTFLLCAGFVAVGAAVTGTVGLYALNVDWSQPLSFAFSAPSDSLFFP